MSSNKGSKRNSLIRVNIVDSARPRATEKNKSTLVGDSSIATDESSTELASKAIVNGGGGGLGRPYKFRG